MTPNSSANDRGAILLGAAAIVVVAICLGLAANHISTHSLPLFASEQSLRPEVPPSVTYVGMKEVKQRLNEPGVMIIDARTPGEFASGHVQGAVNLPVGDFDREQRAMQARLRAATLLICYCAGITCDDGARLSALLSAAGYSNVMLMFEGWEGWQKAGYPSASTTEGGR